MASVVKPEPVKNVDYSGVRNYLGCVYGITSSLKIDDAMALEFERNHFHPILDYLNALKWDGIQRVDKLLIDYMGADDNIYSREAIRKMLVGAVARVMNPRGQIRPCAYARRTSRIRPKVRSSKNWENPGLAIHS